VATSASPVNWDSGHFAVQARTGRERWIDAAEPPFGNRTEATVVTTGDKLLVVEAYATAPTRRRRAEPVGGTKEALVQRRQPSCRL
jgi:hypothetical protein